MVNSLYSVVRPLLLFGRVFGLHPLENLKRNDFLQIRFKWNSLVTFYWLLVWIISLLVFSLTAYYSLALVKGPVTTVFFVKLLIQLGPPVLITPMFLYISAHLASGLRAWAEVESSLPPLSADIQRRLWLLARVVAVGRIGQHLVMDISETVIKLRCVKTPVLNAIHLQYNLKYAFLFIGGRFPSASRVVLSLLYQLITDFQWTCGPILIITVAKILEHWLHSLNSTLERHRDQVMPLKYWQTMRERYNSISRLTRIANDLLHPAILVACITETTFIILFIFMVLKFHWETHVYGVITAALAYHSFVIAQLLMSMSAVSELSKRPLTVLTSVPTALYNEEVSRFYDQVVYDHLVFTGGKVFDISRTFVVQVVSSLITYEVVLLQEHIVIIQAVSGGDGPHITSHNQEYCSKTIVPVYNILRALSRNYKNE